MRINQTEGQRERGYFNLKKEEMTHRKKIRSYFIKI